MKNLNFAQKVKFLKNKETLYRRKNKIKQNNMKINMIFLRKRVNRK